MVLLELMIVYLLFWIFYVIDFWESGDLLYEIEIFEKDLLDEIEKRRFNIICLLF